VRTTFIALLITICGFLTVETASAGPAGGGPDDRWWWPSDRCTSGYCQPKKRQQPTRRIHADDGPGILDRALPSAYLWIVLAATAVTVIALFRVHRAVQDKVGTLQGTTWELVRLMENTTPDGVRNRARIAEDTTEKFAVDGNSRIMRSALISTDQITPDLTAAGLNLMERHANDAAQFRAFRGALRNGISVFLLLMVQKNTDSAFIAMIEYTKRQRDRRDAPNFAELKMVFGLPVDPPDDDELRRILKRGLTFWDYFVIERAVRQRRQIFEGIAYHPPAGAGPITGDAILVEMRAYLH
jgi:hypothetical protein